MHKSTRCIVSQKAVHASTQHPTHNQSASYMSKSQYRDKVLKVGFQIEVPIFLITEYDSIITTDIYLRQARNQLNYKHILVFPQDCTFYSLPKQPDNHTPYRRDQSVESDTHSLSQPNSSLTESQGPTFLSKTKRDNPKNRNTSHSIP